MDGRTAAKEIRKLESTLKPQRDVDPLRIDGRIPIFAVSASLYESDRSDLAQDFDGWLLKPLGGSAQYWLQSVLTGSRRFQQGEKTTVWTGGPGNEERRGVRSRSLGEGRVSKG